MNFYPRNRHVLIEIEQNQEEEPESAVLLPEGYGKQKDPYVCALVKEASPSCTVNLSKGDRVVVETSMVQDISVGDNLYTIVLENYIYGVISNR